MPEAYSVSLQTVSFDATDTQVQTSISAIAIPNYYKYPEVSQKCNYIEVFGKFQELDSSNKIMNIYEFPITKTANSQTITL